MYAIHPPGRKREEGGCSVFNRSWTMLVLLN